MSEQALVADWPVVRADLTARTVAINGMVEALPAGDVTQVLVGRLAQLAGQFRRPVRVDVVTPAGPQRLVVGEDGQVEVELVQEQPAHGHRPLFRKPDQPAQPARPVVPQPPAVPSRPADPSGQAWQAWDQVFTAGSEPAGRGDDLHRLIGRTWQKPHYVAVMCDKGGVGKTVTACLLAAGFGAWSPQPVALIDNNPTGTLVSRLEVASPGMPTILDVADGLKTCQTPSGLWLQGFMTGQPSGRFSALPARNSMVRVNADGQAELVQATLDSDVFDQVMRLAAEQFRVVILDGGNNGADAQQVGAIRWSDCLMLATTWDKQSCKAVSGLLGALERSGRPDLIASAILVPTTTPASAAQRGNRKLLLQACQQHGVEVCPLPRVKTLVDGPIILASQPKPVREATLRMCGAVAARFAAKETVS